VTGATQQYRPRTTRSLTIVTATRDSSSALSPVVPIDRLRMARDSFHDPVLASEIVEMFADLAAGVVVDATLGGAGHSIALLRATPQLRVLGLARTSPNGWQRVESGVSQPLRRNKRDAGVKVCRHSTRSKSRLCWESPSPLRQHLPRRLPLLLQIPGPPLHPDPSARTSRSGLPRVGSGASPRLRPSRRDVVAKVCPR